MRKRLPTGTLRKRGNTWWMRYFSCGHHYAESLNTADGEEARRLFDSKMSLIRADLIRGLRPEKQTFGCAGKGKIRLGEVWDVFLKSKSRPRSGDDTLFMYSCQFGRFVKWVKKNHPEVTCLADVSTNVAWGFMDHLENEEMVSPGTYNKYIDTLKRTYRYAVDDKGSAPTPWDDVRRLKGGQNRRKEFTEAELNKLLNKATSWIRTLFILGLYTGQRLRDCCNLRWEQVLFDTSLIKVIPNKTKDSSGLDVELPMHKDLREHLKDLYVRAGSPSSGYVLAEVARRYGHLPAEVSRDIQDFITSCGFETHREGTGTKDVRAVVQYGFHSLRHSFVSICLRSEKVNREVIRSIVGDSYLLYNHVNTASKRTAVDLMPSMNAMKGSKKRKVVKKEFLALSDDELQKKLAELSLEMERRKVS